MVCHFIKQKPRFKHWNKCELIRRIGMISCWLATCLLYVNPYFWKSSFKQQSVCKFGIVENVFSMFFSIPFIHTYIHMHKRILISCYIFMHRNKPNITCLPTMCYLSYFHVWNDNTYPCTLFSVDVDLTPLLRIACYPFNPLTHIHIRL